MAVAQTEILDKIASLTVLELSELIKAMEEPARLPRLPKSRRSSP